MICTALPNLTQGPVPQVSHGLPHPGHETGNYVGSLRGTPRRIGTGSAGLFHSGVPRPRSEGKSGGIRINSLGFGGVPPPEGAVPTRTVRPPRQAAPPPQADAKGRQCRSGGASCTQATGGQIGIRVPHGGPHSTQGLFVRVSYRLSRFPSGQSRGKSGVCLAHDRSGPIL